ncbi:hypothetical protein COT60_00330 [Candidatus Pacearchaeota archaeon CG09_land_8_20_14_0_10_30_9]|nr:hypothetical protein [Candidatus Pacearchaeota archaeon]OIO40896.1 MAG: hypothetical protein AUJ61_00770 [Candidatus Pacearchaeota archaeon CG1_02_30_18]PIN71093.1 MAG: hypothetical protein COV77_03790 [Candidatus Pacearchaeota archaeon CG11_big_fil_rev_8_21_14_0_20_30_13]PIO01464.1 MAG: hypothetical protein COT60_00330 [Candidatus Pacearchaeota archaeon CG09_land_8_20_14_0_10_30_9]PIZ81638.1 MAG: hypothetical protein COX98_03035 [Candidatus Pacearchaeota archaeon CG_4_10_14_0_2_um_filter_30
MHKGEKRKGFSNVGLFIDDYDDIFSDFDSRPYSQKLLSEDLLNEMDRVTKDKKDDNIELKFFVPKEKRNISTESIIKKRIKVYFKKHFILSKRAKRKVLMEGFLFSFFGVFFMILATFFTTRESQSSIIIFLAVLFEPAGWFLFWEGLDLMIFESKEKSSKLEFYKKLSKSKIIFEDS